MATWASLADGAIPNVAGDLFTAAGETAISSLMIVNTDSIAHTFTIYIKRSGETARAYGWFQQTLIAGQGAQVFDDPQECRLSSGDKIQGVTDDSGGKLDYTILGGTQ